MKSVRSTVVVLGVATAMAVAPAVASAAGTAPQPTTPAKAKKKSGTQGTARPTAVTIGLQSTRDDRTGSTRYRLGDSGLWME
jgi:hypothetical protein